MKESKTHKRISLKTAIKGADIAARRKASKNNLPVAVSVGGETFLLYPDNTLKKATPELFKELMQ